MNIYRCCVIVLLMSCTNASAQAFNVEDDAIYLVGNINKALILAHGRGKHPAWKVVNPIRKSINNRLDWHTLSLQMPVTVSNDFESYAIEFENSYQRINEAITFVKSKGVKTIVLFGHSMGSRMMSAFISENPGMVNGFIMAGCRNYGNYPMNCHDHVANLSNIKILDMYGGGDSKDVHSAEQRNYLLSDSYSQLSIGNANHQYDKHNKELKEAVSDWLSNNF